MRWFALVALVMTGCGFGGGFDGTHYQCGTDGRCPEGQTCVAGFCEAAPIDAPCPGNNCDGPPTSAPCGGLALLTDRFDTTGPGGYWYDFSDPPVTATETGGALVVALGAGTMLVCGGYESAYLYDLTESEIVTKVTQIGGHDTILEVRDVNDGKLQLVVEDGNLSAGVFDVPGGGTRIDKPYDTTQIYWRIREHDNVVYWETSANGTSWNELHHEAPPIDIRHVQGVLAACDQLATASQAKFEEVNLTPPPGAAFCTADMLIDGFDAPPFGPWLQSYVNNGCTIAESGGTLTMSFTGTGSSFCGIEARHLYDMANGSLVIDSAMLPPTRMNFVSYLQALDPNNDRTRVEFGLDSGFFNMVNSVNGTDGPTMSGTYNAVNDRYWRLKGNAAGTQAMFDTSSDGSNWTTRMTATPSFDLRGVYVNFGAGHYQTVANPAGMVTAHLPGINAP